MIVTETWGRSKRGQQVHYFVGGVSLCGRVHDPEYIAEEWNEDNPATCQTCRKLKAWQDLGMKPVPEPSL